MVAQRPKRRKKQTVRSRKVSKAALQVRRPGKRGCRMTFITASPVETELGREGKGDTKPHP